MMKNENKKGFLHPGSIGLQALIFSLLSPQVAISQEDDTDKKDASQISQTEVKAPEQTESKLPAAKQIDEEIVVTGSRIHRNAFSSAAPIAIITAEKSALAGLISPGEILQNSSVSAGQQIDGSFSGFVTDGGPGAQDISLRGLGGNRTLVLVNGRRWGPSGVRGSISATDLSSIPRNMISRIEILKDGASSVYGADAVAGVANIIMRSSIDGGQVEAIYRNPQLSGGAEKGLEGVWGKTQDNWSISIAASHVKSDPILRKNVDYGSCDTRPRLTDQDGDNNIDNRHPQTNEELCFGFIYGLAVSPFGFVRYEPSLGPGSDSSNPYYDATVNGTFGVDYFTTAAENNLDNSGAYYRDTREPNIAMARLENTVTSLTSMGNYDFSIADLSATAYYELYYNKRKTNATGGYRQFFPSVPATNPTNPFGASNSAIAAVTGGLGRATTPVLPSYNLLDPNTRVELDRYNLFTGVQGDLSSSWTYDIYLGYSWSKGTYETHSLLADQVAASLDAVHNSDNQLVCRDLANNPGCVAANLFTQDALINGVLPNDVLNYITKRTKGETSYKSLQFSGHATGEIFELPDGEVKAVIGFDYRRESLDDLPDVEAVNNNIFGSTSAGQTKGSDKVAEIYTEIVFPIFENRRFAELLDIEVAARVTDYDSYGSDTTYRGAFNWQVTPWFRLRATTGTSFRAPDLYEQFLADQTGFTNGNADPCINYADLFNPGDVVYDNCHGFVPADFGSNGVEAIKTVTGGSDSLQAETSDAYTYGFILQPEDFGLSLAVTWYDIDIREAVNSLSPSSMLGACYGSTGRSSPYCARIGTRDPTTGFIEQINASFVNVGLLRSSGYDIDFAYEKEFNTFDLSIDGTLSYNDESSIEVLEETTEQEGHFAYPHWRGNMDVRIDYKDWLFNWRVDHIGSTDEGPAFDPGTTNVDRITSTKRQFTHNLTAQYTYGDWRFIGTVRNITDRKPPIVADGSGSQTAGRVFNTIPGAGYSLFGRTLVLRARYEF